MCDILSFKLADVYKRKVIPLPDGYFWIADHDWETLCHRLEAAGVVPCREWTLDTLHHVLEYADNLTSSQSPKGDGIPTPLQSGVSLNRTAMPGRSRFRSLIHCKLGFTLLRLGSLCLA